MCSIVAVVRQKPSCCGLLTNFAHPDFICSLTKNLAQLLLASFKVLWIDPWLTPWHIACLFYSAEPFKQSFTADMTLQKQWVMVSWVMST